MTKNQIIAELRRSATKDRDPPKEMTTEAFAYAAKYRSIQHREWLYDLPDEGIRFFFLFAACALEDK